jgi:hypothetical protein
MKFGVGAAARTAPEEASVCACTVTGVRVIFASEHYEAGFFWGGARKWANGQKIRANQIPEI